MYGSTFRIQGPGFEALIGKTHGLRHVRASTNHYY